MRIVSLVPHATELLFALGLGDSVVGVTHECDYPPQALSLPKITRDRLPPGLSAAEIDAAVRKQVTDGEAIYELDTDALHDLEPDLIVTQELCPVCAVSYEDVLKEAELIESCPKVIALDPSTIGEAMGDIRTIARATHTRDQALELVARSRARIDAVRRAVRAAPKPRVAAIEWFDPVFIAGHWTPQMIDLAGGIDALGFPGEHSDESTWEMVAASAPDVVVCMPCGYDAQRSHDEAMRFADCLREVHAARVVAVNASAYFSRPGPRIVDGVELMGHILHPELIELPEGVDDAIEVVIVTSAARHPDARDE
jgi:iron complex transport system substrate-binding protein